MNKEQISQIISEVLADNGVQAPKEDKTNVFDKHKMERAIDAGIAKANELKVGVTFAIMDCKQVVQMSYHMPNGNLVGTFLAPKKAWSAIAMKEPTKDISKDIQPGGPLYEMETMLDGKLVSFPGGIPLTCDGEIFGAVGVSGGLIEEDHAICEAGVSEFLKESN
uniref:PduObis protein n=1 Tax=Secundilactobacillus collinoides TaxID=33960 RepID=Q845A8_SECCO|nr:PduObis protein [Secundilactobacillus collinoides]